MDAGRDQHLADIAFHAGYFGHADDAVAVGGRRGLAIGIGREHVAARDGAAILDIGNAGAGDLDAPAAGDIAPARDADVSVAGGGGLDDLAVGVAVLDDSDAP